ncbi:hypothetical protein [Actinomyces sp.]|uniref:hypothetical protein n=1 Tax=Actinomyces sp. TaxID=29317 RepID=UPI0026DC25A7|nr:hypothetical protein [Actinomyces sp.]
MKLPRIITIVGAVLLTVAIGLFVVALRITPTVADENYVTVNRDGTQMVLVLLEDTEYGLYSSDTAISCTVLDPVGTAIDVRPSKGGQISGRQQILGFRSAAAGNYTLSCDGDDEIVINLAVLSPESTRGAATAAVSFVLGLLGLIATSVGVIWLVLRRRSRTRAAVGRLAAHPPTGASIPYGSPGPQPGYAPVPPQPVSSGQYVGVQPPLPVAPTTASAPQAAAPPPGSYGLAPQQVVYRPMPPSNGRPES